MNDEIFADLYGDSAGILFVNKGKPKSPKEAETIAAQISIIAGADGSLQYQEMTVLKGVPSSWEPWQDKMVPSRGYVPR